MEWDDETRHSDLFPERDDLPTALDTEAQASSVVREAALLYAAAWTYGTAQMSVRYRAGS